MWCPRLDHFVRFNFNGTVSRCGHMYFAPQFDSLEQMESSEWLHTCKQKFAQDEWPAECIRCKQTEELDNTSIRLNSIKVHESRRIDDYLQVGGVLDNVCNSACQTCGPQLSTKIGSLISSDFEMFDNSQKLFALPFDRIEHLDISGGEPSASKNYKHLLKNLPKNLRTLRVNTNCSKIIEELVEIQDSGVDVTVTVSFDGIDAVHDYVRWPIQWNKFIKNLFYYKNLKLHALNLWTTVSVLNINDMENIFNFVEEHNLNHSYAFLKRPTQLDVEYENLLTIKAKRRFQNHSNEKLANLSTVLATKNNNQQDLDQFIKDQDQLRGIKILDFIDID
jgi:sulfatase maturation enzyme AslB (radical SAM superfamily)